MLKYFPEHIEDEGKFVRALFIKKYPSSLSDRFLNRDRQVSLLFNSLSALTDLFFNDVVINPAKLIISITLISQKDIVTYRRIERFRQALNHRQIKA